MAVTQQTASLFKPIKVGRITLQHCVVRALLTCFRAYASHVPGPQQASYYAQRGSTSGSLLITEATFISHDAGGYAHVPGIHTDAQIQGWKKVVDAVHAKGSYIFLQLWALGRAADIDTLESQDPPSPYVSASLVALTGKSKAPRLLTEDEIKQYIVAYAKAASNAVFGAGFDGIEVHSANGYLLDQFLQSVSNTRTDGWGGDEHGHTRFTREVVNVVVDAVGGDRVGVRISPWSDWQDMRMPDPRPTFAYLTTALRDKHPKLAYLHDSIESTEFLREIWNSGEGGEEQVFISAGGYTRETAMRTAEDKGGLIAFGRLYMPNPDLPMRLRKNLPLMRGDRSTYYLSGNLTPLGYNDWPFADGKVEWTSEEETLETTHL
ncbi:hypothetical protein JVU11DRAFT_1180 [Chiua virens]|nr:hypothetical protein JVU11DRAFT_1180 [Chiua virens]